MIEVNLLPGKKKAPRGPGFKLALPDFRGLLAQIKDPWLIAAVGATVVLGGAGAFYLLQRGQLVALDARLAAAKAEKRRFDAYIAELRRAERLRDSLIAEIGVIRGIDADRYVWPHILDQIAKALPPYTWLVDISNATPAAGASPAPAGAPAAAVVDTLGTRDVRVSITGRTVDIQAYTTFLRQLANSPWLTDVTPAQSLTRIEADRPVTEFNLTVRYRQADSIYIRTVPLAQSVR
ncbi:MAG TPA: PilN domain-containing protein [Gemmatimonadales bacterium]|nr:PilN domain-containing protein [Gemmatimonadales bacterium]